MTRSKPAQKKQATEITRDLVKQINIDLTEALQEIAARYGLSSFTVGSIRFNDIAFTVKLKGAVEPTEQDKAQQNDMLKMQIAYLGLPADIIGRKTTIHGKRFEICDIDTKKRKYPVIAYLLDARGNRTDRQYKLSETSVLLSLSK